jgi:hypothetical protein
MPLTLTASINALRKEAEELVAKAGTLTTTISTITISSCECADCQKRNYVNDIPADFCGLIVELSCLVETPSPTYADLFGDDEADGAAPSPPLPHGPTVSDLAVGVDEATFQAVKNRILQRNG